VKRLSLVAAVITVLASPAMAQDPPFRVDGAQDVPFRLGGPNGPKAAAATPDRPVPRLPDGKIDLGGVWTDGGSAPIGRLLKPGELDSLLKPEAKKIMESRKEPDDPYFYCMPGGPLRITGGFAWRFVQFPTTSSTHIFMLQEGNAHTYRQIFMNAKHPEDPSPTWYGHSIGRWEGDTLVIDTIGLNTRFWLDSDGTPHSEQLHMIERWTRPTYNTLRRDVTFEDPATFTRPFTVTWTAKLAEPGSEILEYICIENNQYGLPSGYKNPNIGK
jgi:hypothetical protein